MKTANLVIAIIFTIIYGLMFLVGISEDTDLMIGVILLSPPLVMNWLSWRNWPSK